MSPTESYSKYCSSANGIVFELIVQEAKRSNQEVQKYERSKEGLPPCFVNQPYVEFLPKCVWLFRFMSTCYRHILLKALQPNPLGFVPLKMDRRIFTCRLW